MGLRKGLRYIVLVSAICVFTATAASAQTAAVNPDLAKVADLLGQKKYAEAIPLLEKLTADSPSEEAFYSLGNAYAHEKRWDRAIATYQDGAARYPFSSRLWNAAGLVYEQQFNLAKAIQAYRKAYALDPTLVAVGSGRYDPEFDALYIPVVHDHRGVNACAGRLYVYPDKIHYVVYHVVSGFGPGNDDSFEAPLTQISSVEVDRKKGEQAVDYSIITLLTNQSGTRRRIASGEEARIDLKFSFTTPIKGYRGAPWTKADIKFFFIEPETGESLLKYFESRDVKSTQRK